MALKDIWKDQINGDSFINADDINNIAHAVIDLENEQQETVKGENGATFIPSVSSNGVISWTNDQNLPNPTPVNIKGEKGDKGEQGERGLQGVQGIQGERGTDGEKGEKGDKGDKGDRGEKGNDGYTPRKGIDYFDGVDGKNGQNGKDGQDGYTPIKGKDYFDGEKGENGKDGYTPIKGVDYFDGKDGENGKDYVLTEFDKTEIAEQAASLIDTALSNAIGTGVIE